MPTAVRPSATAPAEAPASPARSLATALAQARPACARVLARFRIPPADAEDLIQDAVVLLLRRSEPVERPERWLPKVVAHLCLHYWRARRRRPVESLDVHPEPAGHADGEGRALARHDLDRALATLPLRARRLLLLRHVEGFSARETAARLGYSAQSVDGIGRRGLAALAARLDPDWRGR